MTLTRAKRIASLGAAALAAIIAWAVARHPRTQAPIAPIAPHATSFAPMKTAIAVGGPQPAVGLYWVETGDPTTGTGVCAPQWQLLFRIDNDTLYYKSGTACTAWTPFEGAGGGTVASITCSTGLGCTPNPITTAGTIQIANTTVSPGSYTLTNLTVNAQGQLTAVTSYGGSTTVACTAGFVMTQVSASGAGVLTATCTAIGTQGGVTGTGTAGQVALWTGTTAIDGIVALVGSAAGLTIESTNGSATSQAALIATTRATSTNGNNLCGGGGCQSVVYDGTNPPSGSTNTAWGIQTLESVTTGFSNTAVGENAGSDITTGSGNTATGAGALAACTSGSDNTAVGSGALATNSTTIYSTAVGYNALNAMTAGSNTAVGALAMAASTSGSANVAIGYNVMATGTGTALAQNVCVGFGAAPSLTGSNNVCVGYESCFDSTSGSDNVALGIEALFDEVSGQQNTAVGFKALAATTVSANTGVGTNAFQNDSTGSNNTGVGANVGSGITTGSFNTILGEITGLAAGLSNNVIVGDGSNHIRFQSDANGNISLNGVEVLTAAGHLVVEGAILAAGGFSAGCGTVTALNATDNDGTFTTGTISGTCTITFTHTFTTVPLCQVWVTNGALVTTCTPTATTLPCTSLSNATAYTFSCTCVGTSCT